MTKQPKRKRKSTALDVLRPMVRLARENPKASVAVVLVARGVPVRGIHIARSQDRVRLVGHLTSIQSRLVWDMDELDVAALGGRK